MVIAGSLYAHFIEVRYIWAMVLYIILVLTVAVSIYAFYNNGIADKLIFYPYIMEKVDSFYRFFTAGFIHLDWSHLIFNMLTLYFFGANAQYMLQELTGQKSELIFAFLYLSALLLSSLPGYFKNRDNRTYRALGASGAVCAIVFFSIYYSPWSKIYMYFIPIGIPAILYGIIYMVYSYVMIKKGSDNIGHDAHFYGSAYGFLFALLVDPTHGKLFLMQILHPH